MKTTTKKELIKVGAISTTVFLIGLFIIVGYENGSRVFAEFKQTPDTPILYANVCTIGNVRDEDSKLDTLTAQLEECRKRNEKAGYYVYSTSLEIGFLEQEEFLIEVLPKSIYSDTLQDDSYIDVFSSSEKYEIDCASNVGNYNCLLTNIEDGTENLVNIPKLKNLDTFIPIGVWSEARKSIIAEIDNDWRNSKIGQPFLIPPSDIKDLVRKKRKTLFYN